MIDFPSKLSHVGTTIFTEINKITQRHRAINLAQGFPGFPPHSSLIKEAQKALDQHHNQYAPMSGIMSLREKLSEKMYRAYGKQYDPKGEITITAGATQAIFTAISTFVKQDDEVIVFKPAYDCYEPAIELQGGKPVLIEMKAPEYRINWQEVAAKVNSKTRMIIINTPHNPTGRILTKEDLLKLQNIVEHTNILILSDEVYEHIIYDNQTHQSVAGFPKLSERAIITYSFGKTFHVTGWKVGYCIAPKALMSAFRKVHQFNVFCVNHPMQIAIRNHLEQPSHYLDLPTFFQTKRDFLLEEIKDSRLVFTPAQGTYFQTVSYKNISDEKDTAFAIRLIKEKKLATIPVSAFTKNHKDEKMLRICFAKDQDVLKKAADIINSL